MKTEEEAEGMAGAPYHPIVIGFISLLSEARDKAPLHTEQDGEAFPFPLFPSRLLFPPFRHHRKVRPRWDIIRGAVLVDVHRGDIAGVEFPHAAGPSDLLRPQRAPPSPAHLLLAPTRRALVFEAGNGRKALPWSTQKAVQGQPPGLLWSTDDDYRWRPSTVSWAFNNIVH